MGGFCPHCDANGKHCMTYDSRIQQIQDWLAKCLDTHQDCEWEDSSPPLPTRVLQLDLGDGSDDVRLVDGQGRRGKYAALTYCWGPNPNAIFKTDSTNLRKNQSRVDFVELNLLFREVIKILRSLGVIYLWIDALCIVQDSKNDWENEASKMMSVYSNAYLTMSASESTSPDDFLISRYRVTRPDEMLARLTHVVDHGALSKRGWCLQERCLSRRIVHLGSSQVHWECPEATYDEHIEDKGRVRGGSLYGNKRVMLGPWGFLYQWPGPYELWYKILDNYGKRSLSFEKDRIPALSGLIDLFKRATGDSMIYGLWRADIPRGLLWCSLQTPQCDYGIEAYEPTTLPSWSWLRAHGMSRLVTRSPQYGVAPSIQVVSLDEPNMTITLHGTLFGCPPGSLLNGFQRVVCGSYEVTMPHVDWDFLPESISRCLTQGSSECSGNGAEASAAIWVLVIVEPQQEGDNGWGLVMVRGDHPQIYRRVGLVKIYTLGWLKRWYADRGLKSVHSQYLRRKPRSRTIKLR